MNERDNDYLVVMKDGREYDRRPNGVMVRRSIVKLNKKGRQKLKAELRRAAAASGAPVMPLADIPREERWKDSPERERLRKEIIGDLE